MNRQGTNASYRNAAELDFDAVLRPRRTEVSPPPESLLSNQRAQSRAALAEVLRVA